MASFDKFLPLLLRFEGGFVNDPDDPGGATNKGITLKTFQHFGPRAGFTDTSLAALLRITDEEAGRIYKVHYWDPLRGDEIPLQPLAELLVDFYVNAGTNAIKELQRHLMSVSAHGTLSDDGMFGEKTAAALLSADPLQTYRALRERRMAYYHRICETNPRLQKFLKGWTNRVNAFPVL